jgi:hypothetical protein
MRICSTSDLIQPHHTPVSQTHDDKDRTRGYETIYATSTVPVTRVYLGSIQTVEPYFLFSSSSFVNRFYYYCSLVCLFVSSVLFPSLKLRT